MKTKLLGLLSAGLLSFACTAGAVTYSYVGNFYSTIVNSTPPGGNTFDTTMRVTGSLTFNSTLADMAFGAVTPSSFTFSNGVHTFSSSDALAVTTIKLEIAGGAITNWQIQLIDQGLLFGDPVGKQQNELISFLFGGISSDQGYFSEMTSDCCFNSDSGQTITPGTWSVQSVPEPGSLALLGLGLAGLALARRRAD